MVEEIRLSWNSLLPYIAEIAAAAQEKAETEDLRLLPILNRDALATTR